MTKTVFAPTAQQAAFLEALTGTKDNLALVARAGCGKTSTILMGVDALVKSNPALEIAVCAFNKAIADEVAEKLKAAGHVNWKTVQAATLHSMGFGLLKRAFNLSRDNIDDKKVWNLVADRNEPIYEEYGSQIVQLVKMAKQAGVGFFNDVPIGDVGVWHALADHYDINGLDDTSDSDRVVEAAQVIYRASLAKTDIIDFDDMILLPLIKNLRVNFGKDVIFLDEAQDLSRARQALARKFMKVNTGRMVVVGDDRQAIYGFSGADAAALNNLIEQLNATVMPLTVTWRCPKAVVAVAQTFVPDILAADTAPEGQVLRLEAMPGDLRVGDAILCRNTAPLIIEAYRIIRSGKAAKVEGRAIGEGLIQLAKRWKGVATVDALLNRLDIYRDREIQKAQAKGQDAKIEEINDRVDTLVEICLVCITQGKTGLADIIAFIDRLFSDGAENAIILATYHRSKGREWDRVMLLEHAQRCPSKMARQPWQIAQEHNLAYVAVTRAKKTLAFVG